MTNQLTDVGSGEGFDVLFGDETEEWPENATSKGFRASWFITVFSALLLLMADCGWARISSAAAPQHPRRRSAVCSARARAHRVGELG